MTLHYGGLAGDLFDIFGSEITQDVNLFSDNAIGVGSRPISEDMEPGRFKKAVVVVLSIFAVV